MKVVETHQKVSSNFDIFRKVFKYNISYEQSQSLLSLEKVNNILLLIIEQTLQMNVNVISL